MDDVPETTNGITYVLFALVKCMKDAASVISGL